MSSYQDRKSNCGDKTVVRSSYLNNGISYTCKMSSLYWNRTQELHLFITDMLMHPFQHLRNFFHQHQSITAFWLVFSTFLCKKICLHIGHQVINISKSWCANVILQKLAFPCTNWLLVDIVNPGPHLCYLKAVGLPECWVIWQQWLHIKDQWECYWIPWRVGWTGVGWDAGPRFNIKMSFYLDRKSYCGDKTVVWSSYLHNGISYTGEITSLYWIRALGKMAVFSEKIFSDAISWMKSFVFSLKFHGILFLRVQLTTIQHWFR